MKLIHVVLLALLISPFAAAADTNTGSMAGQAKADNLSAALSHVKCKVDYDNGLISAIISVNPTVGASLSNDTSTLNADYTALQVFVTAGDGRGFWAAAKVTFDQDVRTVRNDIKASRKQLSSTDNATVKTAEQGLRTTYLACSYSAQQIYAKARIEGFNTELTARRNDIAKFAASKAKYDTSALTALVQVAQAQVAALQAAISAARDENTLDAALRTSCLQDGCKTGNFHFNAKWDIARVQMVLNQIKTRPDAANYQDGITAAQADIDAATAALNTVGTAKFTRDTSAPIWSNLKLAQNEVRKINQAIRVAANQARAKARAVKNRQQQASTGNAAGNTNAAVGQQAGTGGTPTGGSQPQSTGQDKNSNAQTGGGS